MTKNYTKGMTAAQRTLFYILWGVVRLLSALPLRVLYLLADFLYIVIYHLIGYRKKLVRRHLADSFPEKSEQERARIERQFYRFFADYIVETLKLPGMSRKQMRRRVTYHGMEEIDRLLAAGHNVALYMGHYCNWEWVTSVGLHLPENVFGAQVYHPLENKVMDALMLRIRASMGTESVAMALIMRKIITTRREGKQLVVGFISDQTPLYAATQYWTDFLNHKDTLVITGTERLVKQADFGCVYLDIRRPRRGYYDITVVPMTENSAEHPDFEITEKYIRLMETTIRRTPHLWLWTHNRWKRTLEGYLGWKQWMESK